MKGSSFLVFPDAGSVETRHGASQVLSLPKPARKGGLTDTQTSSLDFHNHDRSLQRLALNPESDFALQQVQRPHQTPSTDRFIPCRKASNISNKMQFSQSNQRQEVKNMLLSKYKSRILGLEGNLKAFKYSAEQENSTSVPDFICDKFYETTQGQDRVISKTPFKVLDAPSLEDDFYVNLLDWSPSNLLCVGLNSSVYLWASDTCKVSKLCDMMNKVTAVACGPRSNEVAIANNFGKLQVHDMYKQTPLVQLEEGHNNRVGTLHWSSKLLASGSGDKVLRVYDIRSDKKKARVFRGHKQEICGVKWSFDHQQIATGGNDNKLCIWDIRMDTPLFKFYDHKAAIKGLSWSPHQHGLLASGGGAKDRTIKFWNTTEGKLTHSVNTESQVCNLLFSKNTNELVSTHGYTQNQIMFWRTRNLEHFDTLVGHRQRVLYIALSPDGRTIVTGGGDETLRFWNAFPQSKGSSCTLQSSLSLSDNFLR